MPREPARRRVAPRRAAVFLWAFIGLWPVFKPWAAEIRVPNASFESPSTNFVSTVIDDWRKPPRPDWYDEGGGFLWDQLTGLFRNPAPTSLSHIDNCDGDQALWLFAVPEVGLYQELGDAAAPSAGDVVFEAGSAYLLTVGVIGGGGNMLEGVALELAFYYRDDASNQVTVASATITNTTAVFTNLTHLVDFQVRTPAVGEVDPWAGRPIGIRFLSVVDFESQGGYWDLDNVRLEVSGQPVLMDVMAENGEFRFTLESEPGLRFDLLASSDPAVPPEEWTWVTTLTNDTGRATFSEPATDPGGRFYVARQLE